MYCYYQDQHEWAGGFSYIGSEAVGICHHCGVAVCAKHAHKEPSPGAPLLCYECAKLFTTNEHATVQEDDICQPAEAVSPHSPAV